MAIAPGDVPITADGLRANEFVPYGRLAQSMAFFNPPGIERLYSGVIEHLRQHQRVTRSDQMAEQAVEQFLREPARVTHLIAAEPADAD